MSSSSSDGGLRMLLGELLTVALHRHAAGIHAIRIEHAKDIRAALAVALNDPGPALVDLVTDPNALSIPPHITGTQMAGFALPATKVVLSGGVERMLEMARSNLPNIPSPSLLR